MQVENIALWCNLHSNKNFMSGKTADKKLLFRIMGDFLF